LGAGTDRTLYSYCANDPVNLSDESGLNPGVYFMMAWGFLSWVEGHVSGYYAYMDAPENNRVWCPSQQRYLADGGTYERVPLALILAPVAVRVARTAGRAMGHELSTGGNLGASGGGRRRPRFTAGGGSGGGPVRTLQTRGNTIEGSTARALNQEHGMNLHRRDWGRGLESIKEANGLDPDFHQTKIRSNGEVYRTDTGGYLGDLLQHI